MTEAEKEKIYRDYQGKVFGYIYGKLNDRPEAEDLTSEVFIKVFRKLDSFDQSRASLSTWIYTITRNTLTDYFRTRRVCQEIPETLCDDAAVEDEVCSAQMLETLAAALEALEGREREIIILRFYSGKTLKEIAARLGISYAYVKVLQNKALQKLRLFLAEE